MDCPQCNQKTFFEPQYKDNLCRNKSCILYLKGDVLKINHNQNPLFSKQITEILEEFDFEKVHQVMTFLKWEWRDLGVPSVDTIKSEVKSQIERCIKDAIANKTTMYTSTGGFSVYCDPQEKLIQLKFELAEWTAE